MKNVLLIINPRSGRLKNKSSLFDITDIINNKGFLVTTRITHNVGDAQAFAKEGAESGLYDTIVCSGGDGTLRETVAGVFSSQCEVHIGYIPSGSTNDFARSMGISSDIREAAEVAVCGTEHFIDVGCIGDTCFNYIASFGAFTSASYNASQSLKNMLGHTAYVLEGIKDITNIKAISARFESDGKVYEGDYLFGAITNSTSIGGIVKIDDELVEFNDGLFEVCLLKKPRTPVELTRIVRGTLNSDFSSDMFDFFKTNNLKIEMENAIDWSLDGEKYCGKEKMEINIIKSAFKIRL